MPWRHILLAAAGLLALSSVRADWVECADCSSAMARQLASQLPPDRFGVTSVNVIDAAGRQATAFRVHLFYDYEFRSYPRFAQSVSVDTAAQREFDAWPSLRAAVDALQSSMVAVPIESVARLVSQSGVVAGIDGALHATGLSDALLAAGALSPYAFEPADRVPVRFLDGSTAAVTPGVHRVTGEFDWTYVPASPAEPGGDPLPDDTDRLSRLDQIGDEWSTRYLLHYLRDVWQVRGYMREFIDSAIRYRTRCEILDPANITCYAVLVA